MSSEDLDLAALRQEYDVGTLDAADLPAEPLAAVAAWVAAAVASGEREPTAMVVATSPPGGPPSIRTVLLKGVDDGGLVFFTNRTSRKGRELAADPRCAALLRWDGLHRQVAVAGVAEQLDDAASDEYFASRPRGSQLGAWASRQSEVVDGRDELERRFAEVAERHGDGPVPRPPHWGGYRIRPVEVELWQGRPSRLHDRLRYRLDAGAWVLERLSP